jgi:protein O-mannosyl-transferase
VAATTSRSARRDRAKKDAKAGRPAGAATRSRFPGTPLQLALASIAIFAVAFLVHQPSLHFGFLTSWDDPTYVTDNPWIRGLTMENIKFAFTTPYFSNYLPLHLVSYMVDYALWGLNPFGFHLQSVLLAALNAVLAFFVVRRLFGSLALGVVAALLYAVHPSHVEAVAWVSIRKDLLSTVFLLLTLILYDEATQGRKLRMVWYVASVVTFLLGLWSKMSIVALPLFLLVLDFMRDRQGRPFDWKRAIVTKIPYGLLAIWLVIENNRVQVKSEQPYAHQPLQYLMVKGHAVWMYLGLLTGIPEGRPIYDPPSLSPLDLAGVLILPAIFWLAYSRRMRALALGTAWTFALLIPALAFPLITYMADRYLYAPSLGFCWILAAGLVWIAGRVRAEPGRTVTLAALTAIPLVFFAARTRQYQEVWSGGEALWTYTTKHSRDFRALNNLAQVRLNQQRYADAERLYGQASKFDNIVSWQGLATTYYNTKRYEQAQQAIDKSIAIMKTKRSSPDEEAELYYTRGAIEWVRGQNAAAIQDWETAVQIYPQHVQARAWLRTARGEAPPPSPPTSPR